jgi:hypothetical protein
MTCSFPSQPPGSRIVCERAAKRLTLTVPPVGVWRGSAGLFPWGLMVTVFAALVALQGRTEPLSGMDILVLLIFFLVGSGLMLGGLHVGRRRVFLAVIGDRFLVAQTGLFGSKRGEWWRTDLEDVQLGASGATVDHEAVLELQIYSRDGKKFGVLAGWGQAELQWLAEELRRFLRLDALATEPDDAEEDDEPPGSWVVCENAEGLTLTLPPAGCWPGSNGLFGIGLVCLGFVGVIFGLKAAFGEEFNRGWGALCLSMAPFILVGIGALLIGIHMGCRRAVLAVIGDRLLASQTGLFGSRRGEWCRAELTDVRPGWEPPACPLLHRNLLATYRDLTLRLQICSRDGKKFGMLAAQGEVELEWLATMLRRSLRLMDAKQQSSAGPIGCNSCGDASPRKP